MIRWPVLLLALGCSTGQAVKGAFAFRSPAAGDTLVEGRTYTIRWVSVPGRRINLGAVMGGHDKGFLLTNAPAGLDSLVWTVPIGFVTGFGPSSSDQVRLRLENADSADQWVETGSFVITGAPSTSVSDPLIGNWTLNLAGTHYGPGVDRRTKETFSCEPAAAGVACQVQSLRANGRSLLGKFAAAYDGNAYPVVGIPDLDHVSLRRVDDFTAEATFSLEGKPVFAYRSTRARNGRSLTIISLDPVTRTPLTSVVVYDAR